MASTRVDAWAQCCKGLSTQVFRVEFSSLVTLLSPVLCVRERPLSATSRRPPYARLLCSFRGVSPTAFLALFLFRGSQRVCNAPSDEILAFSLCLILTSARLPRQIVCVCVRVCVSVYMSACTFVCVFMYAIVIVLCCLFCMHVQLNCVRARA